MSISMSGPPKGPIKSSEENLQQLILMVGNRIEALKTQYNLFFSGEVRIPPEGEREDIEKMVRDLLMSQYKTARSSLLIQNLSSKFSVYNNMWKKRLNDIETGVTTLQRQKAAYMEKELEETKTKKKKKKEEFLDISLNREDSFDSFFDSYAKVMNKKSPTDAQREKVINSLKAKLISQNLIDAKVSVSVQKGKLKLKIKKSAG